LADIVCELQRLKPELRKHYPISELGIFGSWARGEQRPESYLDVLVDFDGPIGLIAFVGLQQHLSDALGIRVDLVMKDAPKPRIKERILAEAMML
jgi:predicted nucleotidyltransferase